MGKNGGICDGFYLTILDLVCMMKVHKDLVILTNWYRFTKVFSHFYIGAYVDRKLKFQGGKVR
ncbi:hypothetical protein AB685_07645 [Bacillus sp. LL01]|nr:hypothetical protein AB685_07645 [Bacillus sp. LL01]